MPNIESHKSIAIEIPFYNILKRISEKNFRTPSKQLEYLIAKAYPEEYKKLKDQLGKVTLEQAQDLHSVTSLKETLGSDEGRTQYRTWQIVVFLYKNRRFGCLTTDQIAKGINCSVEITASLYRPEDLGLIDCRPSTSNRKLKEWKLSDFGVFVGARLKENKPTRLTSSVVNEYLDEYTRVKT
jgi:hypothetical protein|tara:strand:+ start:768 stop:1316 length:549 start_codon:yes stop_codon:yes gene_type:complete